MPVLLIVEDDEITREMFCEILQGHADWLITAVVDGRTMLRTLDFIKPDLILLDILLEEMDGIDAYRLLREHATAANVPVLFVTANPQLLDSADLTGNYTLIRKPFHIAELLGQVQALLATP
jgi:two-component system, OmpR family, response regulator